jgi:acetylornithine/succinyldiaminopimelate/putrescine aminotransferase
LHVSNLFGNEIGPEVAIAIDELIGDGERAGGQVFFGNSGAEANECAMKIARKWAGGERYVVVSTWDSFHGRTLATLAATGQRAKHVPFAPMPQGFEHVPYDDLPAMGEVLASGSVAGVIVEPILGESGVIQPSSDYLGGLRELCTDHGALLMVDEIQTGLGRTGRWFAFQHAGIEPDVVTIAKALGNGVPIGACWARAEVAAAMGPGDHGSTFGGQPLAASAALATLETLKLIDAPTLARKSGELLRSKLIGLPNVVGVRGSGLLLGVALAPHLQASEIASAALGRGLVVNAPRPDTIRLAPPITVSVGEIDEAVGLLSTVLAAASGTGQEDPR